MARASVLVATGLVLGGVGAWYLSSAAQTFLFRMDTSDLRAYGAALGVLAAAGLLASVVPARRAAGVDPVVALRAE